MEIQTLTPIFKSYFIKNHGNTNANIYFIVINDLKLIILVYKNTN